MSAKTRSRQFLLASAAVGALALSTQGVAQAATADVAVDAPQLEEVIITARKRAESVIDTPIALTAVSAERLESAGVMDVKGLQDFTPGFKFVNQTVGRNDRGFSTFISRGMNPGGDNSLRQATRVFLDGVPIGGGNISGLDAIERIEVVNGPQSAYFGRSTFSGAVNYITRQPSFTPMQSISVDYASFGTSEIKGSVEGPIVEDKLAYRLSGRTYHTDGQYTAANGAALGERNTNAITASLLATPIEPLTVRAFGQIWTDNDGAPAQGLFARAYYNCNPRGGTALTYTCGKISSVPGPTMYSDINIPKEGITAVTSQQVTYALPTNFLDHVGLHREAAQGVIAYDYSLPGDFTVSGNFGYLREKWALLADTLNMNVPAIRLAYVPTDITNNSAEIRLSSPTWRGANLYIGANYLDQSVESGTPQYVGTQTITYISEQSLNTAETLGFFGALNYDVTSKLSMNLEMRYQTDKIRQVIIKNPVYSAASVVPVDVSDQFISSTPKVTVNYKITPDILVYANWAKASRPGQFNAGLYALSGPTVAALIAQTGTNLAVNEEGLTMYEVGFKGDFMDRRLRVMAAAYSGQWRNRHVSQTLTFLDPGTNTIRLVSAIADIGEVDLRGVELQGQFAVTDALRLAANFAYNESEILRSYCAFCGDLTGVTNPVGNRLPAYPAYTGAVSVDYTRDMGSGWTGTARADYVYVGKQFDSEANLAYIQPANRVNLRLGMKKDGYGVELYGKNVFDDKTPTSINRNVNYVEGGSSLIVSPADRATFGIRLSYAH